MEINLGVMENGQRNKESVQLLRDGHDSSSSDVHYHYQLPPPQTTFAGRKKVYRKHRRKSPSGSVSSSGETSGRGGRGNGSNGSWVFCVPRVSRFVNWLLVLAVFVGASALFWVIYGLRLDLVALGRRVHDVEAGNQKLPNQLHEYHTKLKSVTENQTSLIARVNDIFDRMNDLSTQVASLNAAIAKLDKGLMKSGTDDLLTLPDDVTKMQGTMASFGSQLRDVTSELSTVKNSTATFAARFAENERKIGSLESAVARGLNDSALQKVNATLQWAVDDLHGHHKSIEELKASSKLVSTLEMSLQNLTSVVETVSAAVEHTSAEVKAANEKLTSCCSVSKPNLGSNSTLESLDEAN